MIIIVIINHLRAIIIINSSQFNSYLLNINNPFTDHYYPDSNIDQMYYYTLLEIYSCLLI